MKNRIIFLIRIGLVIIFLPVLIVLTIVGIILVAIADSASARG